MYERELLRSHTHMHCTVVPKRRPLSSVAREENNSQHMSDEIFQENSEFDPTPKDIHVKPYPPESPFMSSAAPRQQRSNSAEKKSTRQSQYRPNPQIGVNEGMTIRSPRGTLIVRNSDSVEVGVPLMGKATRESLKSRAISNGAIV